MPQTHAPSVSGQDPGFGQRSVLSLGRYSFRRLRREIRSAAG
jgi:hypothetical protein